MNDRKVLLIIAERLNDGLEDPRTKYGEESRNWVHSDLPLKSATYPRIQVSKSEPGTQEIIDIGQNFLEWNILLVDIWFYTDVDFKHIQDDGSKIKDEELCREYQDKIWDVIKSSQSYFKDEYKITGFRLMSRPDPAYDNPLQKRVIRTTIRLWYFKR